MNINKQSQNIRTLFFVFSSYVLCNKFHIFIDHPSTCFEYGVAYSMSVEYGRSSDISDPLECQHRCAQDAKCKYFSLTVSTFGQSGCSLIKEINGVGTDREFGVFGPKSCPGFIHFSIMNPVFLNRIKKGIIKI